MEAVKEAISGAFHEFMRYAHQNEQPEPLRTEIVLKRVAAEAERALTPVVSAKE